jgi:hypothetical protein
VRIAEAGGTRIAASVSDSAESGGCSSACSITTLGSAAVVLRGCLTFYPSVFFLYLFLLPIPFLFMHKPVVQAREWAPAAQSRAARQIGVYDARYCNWYPRKRTALGPLLLYWSCNLLLLSFTQMVAARTTKLLFELNGSRSACLKPW